MAVLICGGAGYIGSHVNKCLSRNGRDIVIYDNLVYGHREAVKWGKFVKGDLADTGQLARVFSEYSIDAVVHLAAYAYVGESVIKPEEYYINNVSNTLNLLKVMRTFGCGRMVFSSTCATYGEPNKMPVTEDMPQNPVNPYGRTKLMAEQIFRDYEHAYGMKFAVLRYFNAAGADPEGCIGESHDPETHLIPLVLLAAAGKRKEVCVFGTDYDTPDGSCIRDYIHVEDLADAHLRALAYLERENKSCFLNLGNERGTSVYEVIEAVQKVTGRTFPVRRCPRRPGDPAELVGSSAKARELLGWEPKYGDIETIVEHAWKWQKTRENSYEGY